MDPALPNEAADPRMTVEQYFARVDQGVLELVALPGRFVLVRDLPPSL